MAAQQRGRAAGGPEENSGERRGRRDSRRGDRRERRNDDRNAYIERVVAINRVAKTVKGGRRMSFTALVVVGDGNGTVGVGYGKAKEVPVAIAKGTEEAKKSFFKVPRIGKTIPHLVQGEDAAGIVLLRPASPGTGVIAGGPVRAIMECAGIHDVLSKSLGSSNAINIVHATVAALKGLEQPCRSNAWRPRRCCGLAPRPTPRSAPTSRSRPSRPRTRPPSRELVHDGAVEDHTGQIHHRWKAESEGHPSHPRSAPDRPVRGSRRPSRGARRRPHRGAPRHRGGG